jgi:hypothetical protein
MLICNHSEQQTLDSRLEAYGMNMSETARLILGLRAAGWDDTRIADFILWIETGNEKYKPAETED